MDLTFNNISHLTDTEAAEEFFKDYKFNSTEIGYRYKKIANSHYLFNTKTVKLYYQAEQLFCLGLFESVIMVCRATAEYLSYEIFGENLDISDDNTKIFITENLDFRKVVNDYLYKNGKIFKEYKDNFNKIYSIGNNYIHPNLTKQLNLEKDAEECLSMLRLIVNNLKTIFRKYDFIGGRWVLKKK